MNDFSTCVYVFAVTLFAPGYRHPAHCVNIKGYMYQVFPSVFCVWIYFWSFPLCINNVVKVGLRKCVLAEICDTGEMSIMNYNPVTFRPKAEETMTSLHGLIFMWPCVHIYICFIATIKL